jgi:hypothetical protein
MGSTTIVRSSLPVNGAAVRVQPSREEIRNQLALMLASPLFKNSRHYPALLRYVVEETLEGRQGHLKERSLGVDVFGREPNYDTNLDPVVRTSACEVRKRIAQYYHEQGTASTVQIDLPHGTYVPEFHYREPAMAEPKVAPEPVPETARPLRMLRRFQSLCYARRRFLLPALGVVMAIGATAAAVDIRAHRTALERFWSPVWGNWDTLMICLGRVGEAGRPNPDVVPTVLDVMRADQVAFADSVAMGRLTGLFRENHKRFDIRKEGAFTLNDFRKGPAVLIGAFNNQWTMRFESQLRFVFEKDPANPTARIIRDRQNPSRLWRGDNATPYSKMTGDFAVVSRFVDPLTEKMVVVVGGITKDGTMAAGEFVTEDRYLEALVEKAPAGWERKNVQAVIYTEIIDGNAGPPRILATYFW